MTTIRMEDWGISWVLTMKGHANLDVYGKDILCASLSTYAYLLRDVTEHLEKEGLLRDHYIEMSSGHVVIGIHPKQKACGIVRTVMEALSRGFKILSQQYPKSIEYRKRKGVIRT